MATIDDLWAQIVKSYLVPQAGASLPKAEQQALAAALQEGVAPCITQRLKAILDEQQRGDLNRYLQREAWQIHHRGKDFLGGVRWQEADVWLANPEAGLVLAVDPKHFHSRALALL